MQPFSPSALEKIPALAKLLADAAAARALENAMLVEVPAQTTLFRQGDACDNYLIVLEGSVKVFARSEQGREIVLYHIDDGGSCVLTTSCLFAHSPYPAEGVSETALKAVAIPVRVFERALEESVALREFVFNTYSERLSRLITLVQQIAFERIDVRLARYLVRNAGQQIGLTHQNLAEELGTAREVVSRHLKDFESNGWLQLGRGRIEVIDAVGLQQRIDLLLSQ
ncbi:Crp/Fnr family transcriptional regulator [Aestuariirhabdus litorea]|uniref:Crp/Fnr family transcriptional regulator n=1 Tax=Aestuariirhabdus litorea TaxID=2528527 RepID=A0A3P3VKH0_9GAMM|nr:Crp/Fnr family transcriptional regulator [Aestuariirhabdus litorea]RRJ82368.1 Crp/Fnr family transcriptional regulator [Aestuariirhabdus litorea]RWW92531.1 cyclic nucleotide-binding domain-containing protein [Endozoicomonadaceae bacterium GTF-13]